MTRQDQIIATLVSLFALRTRFEMMIKPIGWLLVIHLVANGVEYAQLGRFSLAFWPRTLQTTAVALPFMILFFFVVTHLDKVKRDLADLATTDVLTGLHNRRAFLDRSRALTSEGTNGIVFVIDADYFKSINDTYGHAVGDQCLKAIARRMRSVLRHTDLVGRVGGEEFAAYLPDAPLDEAIDIGNRLAMTISVELDYPKVQVDFTLSIGAAQGSGSEAFDHVLNLADLALYQAKSAGRARLVVWRPDTATRDADAA